MLSNPPYGKSWKTDLENMGGKKDMRDSAVHDHARRRSGVLAGHPIERRPDAVPREQALEDEAAHAAREPNRRGPQRQLAVSPATPNTGESNIRRWIIENDWLEAIVALPLNMFYNTGIATYVVG